MLPRFDTVIGTGVIAIGVTAVGAVVDFTSASVRRAGVVTDTIRGAIATATTAVRATTMVDPAGAIATGGTVIGAIAITGIGATAADTATGATTATAKAALFPVPIF